MYSNKWKKPKYGIKKMSESRRFCTKSAPCLWRVFNFTNKINDLKHCEIFVGLEMLNPFDPFGFYQVEFLF